MQVDRFTRQLQDEGYGEIVTVERPPGGMDEHTHPFEARALILDGEMTITVGGESIVYRAGDIFHLPAGLPHSETYGPDGVRYRVGRR